MADDLVSVPGSGAAPLSYEIAGAQEIVIRAARASFDGSGAAGAFLPALRITDGAGQEVGTYPTDTSVAAAGSADVSFAPFLRNQGAVSATVGWEHNDVLVADEPNLDFEDSGSVTWTLTDDAANSRVKVSAAASGSGANYPHVATLYRSNLNFGDPAQAVGAGSSVAITFVHTALPGDGSVSWSALVPYFLTFNVECIALSMLWVQMDGGGYSRAIYSDTNSRILQASIPTPAGVTSLNNAPVSGNHVWMTETKPNAFVVNDTVSTSAYNGDVAAHNIVEAWWVVYFWPITGYGGGIPGWPP